MKKISAPALVLLLFAFTSLPEEKIISRRTGKDKIKHELHGTRVTRYENGNLCDSGRLHKGIPDGTWVVWYPDGTLRFYRTYSADKWRRFNNETVRYHPRHSSYPLTRLYHDDRTAAEFFLRDGISFCNPASCSCRYKTNSGMSANDYHPVFKEGLLHGLFINYFGNGAAKDSGYYDAGLREGVWVHRSDDQKTFWEGAYLHGKKNKEWKFFAADGILLQVTYYNNGKETWSKEMLQIN